MAILTGDIKLLKSAVMADVPEGGGAPTGIEIPDGVSNAIYPDISELDRAGGDVSLRKVFAKVQTANVDSYLGANVIVAEPPQDPRVSVTLFRALDSFEQRASAQSRMEAYLFRGAVLPGYLLENHIQGQRVVQLFYRPEQEPPAVGAALHLSQDEGLPTYQEQYIRVIKVDAALRKYVIGYEGSGGTPREYTAKIVSLELSDPLRYNFRGSPPSEFLKPVDKAAQTRETVVADASAYAGCVPLAQSASLGQFGVRAESIFTQLVPSAQVETPIPAQSPHAASGLPMQAGAPVRVQTSQAWSATAALQLPGGFLPGSLQITGGPSTITDAAGTLQMGGGTIGTADYADGILSLNDGSIAGTKTITYTPATRLLRAPQSACIDVTIETRSLSYVGFIDPVPQRATLVVSYMAQGRWYALADGGNGQLRGLDAAYGAGTINADTGAFVITLGALPDVGSAIVIQWGVPTQETLHPAAEIKASQRLQLAPPYGLAVQPGSMSLSWPKHGGGTATATVGTDGLLVGDATGRLWTGADAVDFVPNAMPPTGALITVDYVAGPKQIDNFTSPARDGLGRLVVTASLGALTPGSVEIAWNTVADIESASSTSACYYMREMGLAAYSNANNIARDDGAGNLLLGETQIGTVDYATGVATFAPDVIVKIPGITWATTSSGKYAQYNARNKSLNWVDATSFFPADGTGYVKLSYNAPGSTSAQQEVIVFEPTLRLVEGVSAAVVPGSVTLAYLTASMIGGVWSLTSMLGVWVDNGSGVLRQRTAAGDGWITRGSLDYLTGKVTLASWEPGAKNKIMRLGTVTTTGEPIQSEYVFRTAAAPVRPGSLSVQFARAGGGVQTVTFPASGILSAPRVIGEFDAQTGLCKLRFGEMVTAAGNEGEPWYFADYVDAQGKIFRPEPVATSTVKYTAVAFSYLPLDAALLGIDPVRLPTDGRVPIFRPGGFAVVGHTGKITATVSNGQTINCARVRLSRVRVVGADGVVIHTGYTADLEAGTVGIVDTTGWVQPVTIEHRIEDMAVVRDVQITGDLTFTRPLTHSYPLGSYVSSALVGGDLFARVSHLFDQQTWGNRWKDTPDGATANATYNATQYPIEVTNAGALTERWAIRFANTTAFELFGENVGVIATGNTSADLAPINPATGVPYLTLRALGWGGGWAAGNVLRLNTVGAEMPLWTVRTVQQGPETVQDDGFALLIRGDVDAAPATP